jgi:hypothetical protein
MPAVTSAPNVVPLMAGRLSGPQAARLLFGVHENTLFTWLKDPAMGVPHIKVGRHYWLYPDECMKWLEARTKNPLPVELVAAAKPKPKPRLTKRSTRPKRAAE